MPCALCMLVTSGIHYLTADGGDLFVIQVCVLIHGGKLALVVHLQQLESSGAVAHLMVRLETSYMQGIWTN